MAAVMAYLNRERTTPGISVSCVVAETIVVSETGARLSLIAERVYDFQWGNVKKLKHKIFPVLQYRYGSLDDEDDYSTTARVPDIDQFVEMLAAAGGGRVRELSQAFGHQGDGLCFQPANAPRAGESKVEPAVAVDDFRPYLGIVQIGQGTGGQRFGQ